MLERSLAAELTARFARVLQTALPAYMLVVLAGFAVASEVALRRSLERSADVIEALLGRYADPEGAPTTAAPAMLADQLIGMREPFAITRAIAGDAGSRTVYFLSPTMPAKRLGTVSADRPDAIREQITQAIADRSSWRTRILQRRAGDFDIYVIASRNPYLVGLAGLVVIAGLLLPVAALAARRGAAVAVVRALAPLARVANETRRIGPDDLDGRITTPTGQREVTELADDINRMLARVERTHVALEAFTADASHELRTPLTHLRLQAHWALEEARDTDEMRDALAAIERDIERTTKLVDDMLLIARSENRQIAIARDPFDLTPLVRDIEEVTRAMAAGRDVTVRAILDGPVWALGDAGRTRQIILNLTSNAIRYTPSGCITLSVERDGVMAGVSVRDTGVGIPGDHLGRVFDRFWRGDVSRSRAHGGSGLGLTIAKLLAELQGGRITADSSPGKGSVFAVWLPRAGDGDD